MICRAALGIANTVKLGSQDEQELSALSDGKFFDVVFEATGNAKAMERAFQFVAHGGTHMLLSIVGASISFSDLEFHKRETKLLASRNATAEDFDTVLEAMRAARYRARP